MRELRRDPVADRWVIFSAERADRPMGAITEHIVEPDSFCPFCEGAEASTPSESFALREEGSAPDGPGWRLRVVPNKFPALSGEERPSGNETDIYQRLPGVGRHEVIIETPEHDRSLADMPEARIAEVFGAVRGRMREYRKDERIRCAQFFKNHGQAAGASLPHSHSQLIGMPVVSKLLAEELEGAARHYRQRGRCVFCDIIEFELSHGQRVIERDEVFVALAPFASRFPYEAWLVPTRHEARFDDTDDAVILALAGMFKQIAARLNRTLDDPPYNLMLHTAPFGPAPPAPYHWHIELMPVMGRAAGFEWGAGFHINSVFPEDAARVLREAP